MRRKSAPKFPGRERTSLRARMLRSAPNKVKHGARSCLGIGDVFLITKESDSKTVEKYKNMAVSEKARADENAEEIHELREMLNGARGGSAELAELKRALDDRTDKLREAEEARRASQAAAQAAIEESLQEIHAGLAQDLPKLPARCGRLLPRIPAPQGVNPSVRLQRVA